MEENLLEIAIPEEAFKKKYEVKDRGPVPDEEALENIRETFQFDLPILLRSKEKKDNPFIFVAGGPTLLQFIDEVRERKKNGDLICTSNFTHDFLIDQGIIPDICSVIDPKKIVANYIKKPHKDVRYLIATVCNKDVFQNLITAEVKVEKILVGYGMSGDRDVNLQQDHYHMSPRDYLVGGTMMGLRAMNLAELMGYKTIEYYGMDSCFSSDHPELIYEDDPRYKETLVKSHGRIYEDASTGKKFAYNEDPKGGFFYAYPKQRGENVCIVKTIDGRRFLTSITFAEQAKQFIKWAERFEGRLNIILHGDSLTSHMWNLVQKYKVEALATIGDRRWTDGHEKKQKALTDLITSPKDIEIIARSILSIYSSLKRPVNILDYGCGKTEDIKREIDGLFKVVHTTNYDPFVDEYSQEPSNGLYDLTTCFHVMDNVEYACIDNVLKHIAKLTKYIMIFTIKTHEISSEKPGASYPTSKSPDWWITKLNQYFYLGEATKIGQFAYYICQKTDAKELMEQEMNHGH